MVFLYVTTDRFEAETLIEDTEPNQEPKYKYYEFGLREGEGLAKRIGFKPMCSVEMNGNVSPRELETIGKKLAKEGLYVATETNGKLQKYIPTDAEISENVVKVALRSNQRKFRFNFDSTDVLLFYSNNLSERKRGKLCE